MKTPPAPPRCGEQAARLHPEAETGGESARSRGAFSPGPGPPTASQEGGELGAGGRAPEGKGAPGRAWWFPHNEWGAPPAQTQSGGPARGVPSSEIPTEPPKNHHRHLHHQQQP